MAKIEIPNNFAELLGLAKRVNTKHVADADKSPLHLLPEVNWTQLSSTFDKCNELHTKAEELRRQADQLYKERDLLLKPVEEGVKKSRNFLKTVHTSNPKKLGEWGFDVVD